MHAKTFPTHLSEPLSKPARWRLFALTCACLAGSVAQAQTPAAKDDPVAKPPALNARHKEPVTLNFVNAEIDAVARTLATLSGYNVVVDPRVKGTMSLSSNLPVPPAQALRLFAAQLRTQGFALVESAGLYTVLPEAEAKLQSSAVSAGPVPASSGQIVTQIFRLNHENANNLVPVLRPLISPNNTINVNPGTNALVITDYGDNLQRLGRIIAALDVANATGVEVIRLKHGIAADLAPMLQRLIDSGAAAGAPAAQGQTDNLFKTTVLAETRTNSLIVRAANPARLALTRSLAEQLDQPNATGAGAASGNIHVVYLKNADATKLATTLRAAMTAQGSNPASGSVSPTTSGAGLSAPGASAASAQPSTGGQIQADPATNALIITAPQPQYRQLRAVIDMLDQRRAQVFVESLIAEVSADKAADFGVQWLTGTGTGSNTVGVLGTNFSGGANQRGVGTNLLDLAAGAATGKVVASTGLNIALGQQRNGALALGALARFLQANGDANVLSTPNLLTLDNEEAKIVIGQNVPFVTGQYTANNSNSGAVNPFQTIERKDVGLTLRVKPQISESGTVKLQIFQEVSSIDSKSSSSAGLITNKRSIETNVLVDDGSIIVLGGLLQDDTTNSQDKVPGLGDLPIFGNLFKSEARSRKKTNLMVFLRPVVVRDGAATEALSLGRYEQMRMNQQGFQPAETGLLPISGSAVLPPIGSGNAASAPAPDAAPQPAKP
ncbi:type II secretion system protein GspD [Limnohabitans sp. 2KL-17]|uniref:type II secretion system secretin GspD n=1 Tax=Limnohabitans sp. 2KL-17 TaxID=1100704 RepID=UPI000D34C638|nr:type II secretion system secretin GspD [Limnohabitans sp. 2KL-17]PUE53666.1 type II secretion system protein GspD [Limnohabitans sp. 2KL-17]